MHWPFTQSADDFDKAEVVTMNLGIGNTRHFVDVHFHGSSPISWRNFDNYRDASAERLLVYRMAVSNQSPLYQRLSKGAYAS